MPRFIQTDEPGLFVVPIAKARMIQVSANYVSNNPFDLRVDARCANVIISGNAGNSPVIVSHNQIRTSMTPNPIKTLLLLAISMLLSINMVSAATIPAYLFYDTASDMIWFQEGYYSTFTVSLSASGTSTFVGGTIDGSSFEMTSATYGSLLLNSTSDSNPAETNTLTVYASGLSFEYSNGLVSSVSTTVSATGMDSAWSYSSLGASDQATLENVLSGLSYITSTDSRRIYIQAETYVVPEPSTYAALAGLGVLAFAGYRRRAIRKISSM